jgi:hypothetical protein
MTQPVREVGSPLRPLTVGSGAMIARSSGALEKLLQLRMREWPSMYRRRMAARGSRGDYGSY